MKLSYLNFYSENQHSLTNNRRARCDYNIMYSGTLCKAASLLKEKGATQVYAVATHGVFSGPAMERITNSCLEEVCVTDSLPQAHNLAQVRTLSISLAIINLIFPYWYTLRRSTPDFKSFSSLRILKLASNAQCKKLKVITLAPLFAEAIRRLHNEQSLSGLFGAKKVVAEPVNPNEMKL